MSNAKVVMGQAANTLTAPLNVEDVFSTYLYTGTASAQTITNGIDLDGEGGLVWIKNRGAGGYPNVLFDSERGVTNYLRSETTGAENSAGTYTDMLTSFNSEGFSLGSDATTWVNNTGSDLASWTFRKAPKFFTCLTYTGTGSAQNISHDLGSVPGMIIAKRTDSTGSWITYHRSLGNDKYLLLQETNAAATGAAIWDSTTPTDSVFTVGALSGLNLSGATYVAYLFAHNDGDGGFNGGDIIKCGSYTGNNGQPHHVELGFEPQWLLVKNADLGTGGAWWSVVDVQREMTADTDIKVLKANESEAEINENGFSATATGFTVSNNNDFQNNSTNNYIYIAIRRGTKVPKSATEVFAMDTLGSTTPNPPSYNAGFPVDLGIMKSKTSGTDFWRVGARLTGEKRLKTNSNEAEATDTQHKFDYQDGWYDAGAYVDSQYQSWMWKRAPKFFDAVAYTGDGTAGRTVSHNLGVAPEMMWVKARSKIEDWSVYHAGITNPEQNYLYLNSTSALNPNSNTIRYWNHTNPTDSVFTLGDESRVNGSGHTYISYLFASLAGVSKVGSYDGDGTTDGSKVIDCGFTSGARFVMIKAYNTGGDWMVYDTERGIVVGNDPVLSLNDTAAEATTYDNLVPNSSGFAVVQNTDGAYTTNESGHSYIFYAIA